MAESGPGYTKDELARRISMSKLDVKECEAIIKTIMEHNDKRISDAVDRLQAANIRVQHFQDTMHMWYPETKTE